MVQGHLFRRRGPGPSRRFFYGLLFVLLVALPGCAWGSPALVVCLQEKIRPRATEVYLGEYASLEGDQDLVDRASLARLVLSGRGLSRQQVVEALQEQGLSGIPVRLLMPPVVEVQREDRLEERLRRAAKWPWRVVASPEAPVDPETPLPEVLRSGMKSLSLNVAEEGEPPRFVRVRLRWLQPLVVSRVHLRKGVSVNREDVTLRLGQQDTYRPLAHSFDQVAGRLLRIPVKAGVPLALEVLLRDVVVHAGNQVVLVGVAGAVVVEVRGKALEQGAVGDFIRVRNLDTRHIVEGVVTAPGRVEILQKGDGGT